MNKYVHVLNISSNFPNIFSLKLVESADTESTDMEC